MRFGIGTRRTADHNNVSSPLVGRRTAKRWRGSRSPTGGCDAVKNPSVTALKKRRATSPQKGEETMLSHHNDAGPFAANPIACRIMSPFSCPRCQTAA
ncbi:hypothetical protein BREVUG8_10364 [Brevundimonas sp. G8]|nr:hypothetical protein BREVUG8_10364 [Brevundimonas sp. G8]